MTKPGKTDRESDTAVDDVGLFRDAVGPVRRLQHEARADARPVRPAPKPLQHLRDEANVLEELRQVPLDALAMESGEALSYLRDGHDPRLLKRLKSGAIAIRDEIDLHAMRLPVAQRALRAFLGEAVRLELSCVRIIHGKGLRSEAGPVLKALVDRSLRQRGDVIAYCSARERDGGTGATVVLLNTATRR